MSNIKDIEIQAAIAYWQGHIQTTPVQGEFRASQKKDVVSLEDLSEDQARHYEKVGLESLLKGEGVIGVLKAGASSRMNVAQAPDDVKSLIDDRPILSKAAVPVGVIDGDILTYDDSFGLSVARLLQSIKEQALACGLDHHVDDNIILSLTNKEYFKEHLQALAYRKYFALQEKQFRFFEQRLGCTFQATPDDVDQLQKSHKFSSQKDYQDALAIAEDINNKFQQGDNKALIAEDQDPWGHGEFFHQLISSGEFLHLYDSGKKWISLKNIDNYAAKFDKEWLKTLGKFLSDGLDFQPEVSPRAPGQNGGSLIVRSETNRHELTEDTNLNVTFNEKGELKVDPWSSYWINNAVAIMSLDFIINIYKSNKQSNDEFIKELRSANAEELEQIANRGRQKFPKLMGVKLKKNGVGGKNKPETNLWQATGVVDADIRIQAIGVMGARNFQINDYSQMSDQDKAQALAHLRFLATKQWQRTKEDKIKIRDKMSQLLGYEVSDAELALTLESYEGNKILSDDLLRYILTAEVVTPGILKSD